MGGSDDKKALVKQSTKSTSVVFSTSEMERMAKDEKYAAQKPALERLPVKTAFGALLQAVSLLLMQLPRHGVENFLALERILLMLAISCLIINPKNSRRQPSKNNDR